MNQFCHLSHALFATLQSLIHPPAFAVLQLNVESMSGMLLNVCSCRNGGVVRHKTQRPRRSREVSCGSSPSKPRMKHYSALSSIQEGQARVELSDRGSRGRIVDRSGGGLEKAMEYEQHGQSLYSKRNRVGWRSPIDNAKRKFPLI